MNCATLPDVVEFDAASPNLQTVLQPLRGYGKLEGWLRALSLGLPVSGRGHVVCSPSFRVPGTMLGRAPYLCRPDAPTGLGAGLPRGRDLTVEQIGPFLGELRKVERSAVILAFVHPSIEFLGEYRARFQTAGAATILRLSDSWIIETVGPGYDVGDLTRGVAVHTSFRIPNDEIPEQPSTAMRLGRQFPGRLWEIDQDDYRACRLRRIALLQSKLGERLPLDIERHVPHEAPRFTLSKFRRLQRIVWTLAYPSMATPMGQLEVLLLNAYHWSCLHAFEIWRPERSYGFEKTR